MLALAASGNWCEGGGGSDSYRLWDRTAAARRWLAAAGGAADASSRNKASSMFAFVVFFVACDLNSVERVHS